MSRAPSVVFSLLFTASVACLAMSATTASAATRFAKGPYLEALGASSVEVRVELDSPSAASLELTRDGEAPRQIAQTAETAFHVFPVDHLAPQTTYGYVVRAGAAVSAKGTLTTAPEDASGAAFKFLVYGDNRSNDDDHAAVVRAMQRLPVDFLVNTGDFVERGSSQQEWQTFFDIEQPLLRDHCAFSSVGNHELFDDNAGSAFERYFGPSTGKLYGTFRWSSTRFFLLNAFTSWSGGEEREWLTRELERADSEPGLQWRIVVVHFGPFSSGPHGNNERLLSANVPQLLGAHKIDLVISGHDHIYERGEAVGSGYDLRYLVSGGGGAPLYKDIKPLPSTKMVEAAHHAIEIDVDQDAVSIVARRSDGSTIESSGFTHAAGWNLGPRDSSSKASGPSTPAFATPALPNAAARPPPTDTAAPRCACRAVGSPEKRVPSPGFAALFAACIVARIVARIVTRIVTRIGRA